MPTTNPPNLLLDSEFTTYPYTGWTLPGGGSAAILLPGGGPNGSNALGGPTDGSTFAAAYLASSQQLVTTVTTGESIVVSSWMDLSAATSGSMYLILRDQTGTSLKSTVVSASTEAAYVWFEYVIQAGSTSVYLQWNANQPIVCPALSRWVVSQPQIVQGYTFPGYTPTPGQTYGGWSAARLKAASHASGVL